MKSKIPTGVVALLLLIGAGALGYLGYRNLVLPQQACDICGRERHQKLQAVVFMKDNSRVEVCCPRCALHVVLEKANEAQRATVEDSTTGESITAEAATYVEGSDAESCHPGVEPSLREPAVKYELKFDRCRPSLVAFKQEGDARRFQIEYGGRILSFAQAIESVKQR